MKTPEERAAAVFVAMTCDTSYNLEYLRTAREAGERDVWWITGCFRSLAEAEAVKELEQAHDRITTFRIITVTTRRD